MTMPLVSVVMPAWNGERYVAAAIRSVLDQTLEDLELIVVDDGSTDATPALLAQAARDDPRVRVVSRANSGGPAVPKNDGIAAARGRYLSFLDCDDLYDAGRCAALVDGLRTHPHWVAAFHDLRHVESDGSAIAGTYLADAEFLAQAAEHLTPLGDGWYETGASFYVFQSLRYAAMHTQTVMIDLERAGRDLVRFDTRFVICEDTDLWIRLGMHGRLGYLDRVLSAYRQHGASITTGMERRCTEMIRMHAHNYARLRERLTREQARRYRDKIASFAADLGYWRVSHGNPAGARAAYALALRWRLSVRDALGLVKSFVPRGVRQPRG
jgi:glycosyltransferase involved in cell wall biosynthesis